MSIPPYLTSGASSRAHHAFIVALTEARSVSEEDTIVDREIRRAKESLSSRPSTSKIAETLIILLHCTMTSCTAYKLDWALMPALQLAEGGKTVKERRIGYLYLCERLPRGHELELMVINTIRKDLTSTSVPDIILGLHATTHLPSADLLPAVIPLLTARSLLRHRSAMVRHNTLSALAALFFPTKNGAQGSNGRNGVERRSFPLNMAKLAKLLDKETEAGPAAVLLRLMRTLIAEKLHEVRTSEEGVFLVETVIAQTKRADAGSQLSLDALKVLQVLNQEQGSASEIIASWLSSVMRSRKTDSALLLATCSFVSSLSSTSIFPSSLLPVIVKQISALLLPHSTTSTRTVPNPNDHVLSLRCLALLPVGTWDTMMGEGEMQVIMEGLNSVDDTIRLATLRLLQALSPELLAAALQNHLESLVSSTNLALPLDAPERLDTESKLKRGREETARRALEVVEVQSAALPDRQAGEILATGVVRVCGTLSGVESEGRVWEAGLKAVLRMLQDSPRELRQGFVESLLSPQPRRSSEHTLAVLRATTSVEYGQFTAESGPRAVSALLDNIPSYPYSIQELSLVASVGIISRLPNDVCSRLIESLNPDLSRVRGGANSYMQKRCDQIERVISNRDLLMSLDRASPSRALPDILATLVEIAKPPQPPPSSDIPSSSRSLATSALRYDAYTPSTRTTSRSRSRSRAVTTPLAARKSPGSPSMSAGEYALFSADEYDDQSALLDEEGRVDNLVGLSLGESSGSRRTQRRVPDPFRNDSDDPTTPRL